MEAQPSSSKQLVADNPLGRLRMELFVAARTQCDQIRFRVVSEQAALLNVMHLEFAHGSAILAPPSRWSTCSRRAL